MTLDGERPTSGDREPTPQSSDRDGSSLGCPATLIWTAALAIFALPMAVVRGWQSWRRGPDWRIEVHPGRPVGSSDHGAPALDLFADIPLRTGTRFSARLTDAIVRVAEALRRPDDVYHHIYRIPGEAEAMVMPVGPQLQELGERMVLALGQGDLEHRTAVWLTLDARSVISDLADPRGYDPEADGEPEGLIERSGARWAMATSRARSGPSTVYRVLLWVPDDAVASVQTILKRLEG